MDKQQAQNFIEETFEQPFDKVRFTAFIKNLLNRIEETPTTVYRGNLIPDAYEQYISSLERIGKYTEGEHKIDILIVKLKKETSLERARTMQRNFIAWYLNGSRGGVLKDAALAAFVSPDEADWRFSLVKMDYRFEETPAGKMKVKEEFTPARRWSFLVGTNEKSHTAQSRLVKILAKIDHNPTLAELEEAFNIETVTREFFLKYRDLFVRTKEELDKVVKNDARIQSDFEVKGVNTVDFAKKLLGQIVFLYFLQKKGWFGVDRDAEWGTGSRQFLRELFNKKHGDFKNFFNDILEHLFYDALRNDRSHDDHYYGRFNCKIPFLNGGLFDPIGNYDWVHTDIHLPDDLFSNDNRTKEGDTGNGILDVFDRYNFTVKEDEPLEKEVAIDPELLGKAYEKFNAIRPDNFEEYKKALKSGKKGDESKFNKQFGVYYTPREIVHYMCQQSLINYLSTELTNCHSRESGNPDISPKDIETLIHLGEQVRENEARVERKGKETSTYSYKLPESIRTNSELIDNKLEDITVCDPAVGSGAFPVGMMSEIVKARNVLSTFIQDEKRTPYNFKRRCIEHSLYGVDIDPGAVEIAKLRLWLSLVVDEDDIKNIKPLPNLDYKIVCGNSLLGIEKDIFNYNLLDKLEKLKSGFFSETNPTQKQLLRTEIDTAISGLYKNAEKTLGYKVNFDFQINFSEVFHEPLIDPHLKSGKVGFDVAIANPPYIFARNSKGKGLTAEAKRYFYDNYKLAEYQVNLYPLFIEKADRILSARGNLTFITPNNWLTINTNKTLRAFVLQRSNIMIVNFYARVFDSAEVDSAILIYEKGVHNPHVRLLEYTDGYHELKSAPASFFAANRESIINIEMFKGDENQNALLSKIETAGLPLARFADVKTGLVAYEVGKGSPPQTKQMKEARVYHNRNKPGKDWMKYLQGSDVCRFSLVWSGEYIKYGENLAAPRRDFRLYSTKRILVRQIPNRPPYCIHACYTADVILNDRNSMNVINIKADPMAILCVLNSRLISYWFARKFGKLQRGLFPQFKANELADFPIPKKLNEFEQQLADLSRQATEMRENDATADISKIDEKIDRLVCRAFGLTEDEIAVVEEKSS